MRFVKNPNTLGSSDTPKIKKVAPAGQYKIGRAHV